MCRTDGPHVHYRPKSNWKKKFMATTNAKEKIKTALVELLNEKDFEKISILDIVRQAGVGRSTYYYHYFEQQEVLDDVFNDVFERFCDTQRNIAEPPYSKEMANAEGVLYQISASMIDYLLSSKELLETLFFGSVSRQFAEGYRDYFMRTYSMIHPCESVYDRYMRNYLCAGQYHLLETMVQNGRKEDRDDMIKLLYDINYLVAKGVEKHHDDIA